MQEMNPTSAGAPEPEIEITPAMIEAALDVLWEHRATVNLDHLGPDLQERLVQELLVRSLSVAPSAKKLISQSSEPLTLVIDLDALWEYSHLDGNLKGRANAYNGSNGDVHGSEAQINKRPVAWMTDCRR